MQISKNTTTAAMCGHNFLKEDTVSFPDIYSFACRSCGVFFKSDLRMMLIYL